MMSNIDSTCMVDIASLASQLVHPRRPQLTEVQTIVAASSSGSAAWTSLFEQGLLPAELLRSPERRFAVVNTERGAAAVRDELDLHDAPPTLEAAVAIASDATAVLETEQLARAVRSRLVAWGAEPVARIDWIVLTHQIPFAFRQGPAFDCAIYSLEYALQDIDIDMHALRTTPPWLPPLVGQVICASDGWAIAAAESLVVPAAYGAPRSVVDTEFRALENPFEMALQLWARGYVLDHLREQDRPDARLFTFVVDAPPNLLQQLREQSSARDR
jgi:hypothetical protein